MPLSESDALRIRLEGRLEVIESATQSLEELEKLLRAGKWPDTRAAKTHLQTWESLQARLPDALEAAHRAGGTAVIARLKEQKQSLERSLQQHFSASSVGRARDFAERLALWHQLLESSGLPARAGPAIAELTVKNGRWWRRSVVHYRLFADVLVREREGEPTLQLPLTSFDAVDVSPGTTVQGLVDLELPKNGDAVTFCARMKQLANEREVLRREERSLERFAGPAGRWLGATLKPDQNGQPESVEVLSFAKAERGTPIEMKARRGAAPAPKVGLALLCERGLLFIPQSTQQAVREVLFDTERVELMHEQQRPLSTFPSELILDHLEELRRIVGVQWCAVEDPLKWTRVDQREELELPAGRLSVSVDESARNELRMLWPV